ncbi:MAG: D-alanyl-D-alanine carboxypeptidase/D-alanyl-D-alanine endopeptidase [Solirubrobacteraceae bacterium]
MTLPNGHLRRALIGALAAITLLAAPSLGFGSQANGAANGLRAYIITPQSDVPPPAAPPSNALRALQARLGRTLNGQGGYNGALVVDETTDRTLWAYKPTTGRLPASVEKLWTTTTALFEFGPKATFKTSVLGVGRLSTNGTYTGTIYLRGGGDPTFGSAAFDQRMYNAGATVQSLARAVRAHGIRRIDGTIVGDASYFDSLEGGPASDYHANLETEGAISALSYDAGFTNILEEQLVHNPALSATRAFTAALRAAGVAIPPSTRVRTGVTPAKAALLAAISSPKLSELLALTNSPSDNFFAEMLLKNLGARFGGVGSTAVGAAVVRKVIAARFGLHPRLNDGSGLSRYDRSSPQQMVLLLREMQSDPYFWNSLAVAGVRGTMKQEMVDTSAAGNCRGKTGSLHDVANLVGYCRAANGNELVFAFMMNGLSDSSAGHLLEDQAAEALAAYRG